MNTQNSNKTCANCKHWFLNPHVEYSDITKAEGRCLVSDTFTRSDNVCNAWELSLLYDIDKPVLASDKIYYWPDKVPELPKPPEDNE